MIDSIKSILCDTEKYEKVNITSSELADLVSNRRRREVIKVIDERHHDDPISISELAEQVSAITHGVSVGELDSKQRKRTYVSLYQCHIPKLDQHGVALWDKESDAIEKGENLEGARTLVSIVEEMGEENESR